MKALRVASRQFLIFNFEFLIPLALALLLIALTGCSFLKPVSGEEHFYLLTGGASNPSPAHRGSACVVRLAPVEVPDYLQTRAMAVRAGSSKITFSTFHQWAEPLDAGIRRVLAQNLRRFPGIGEVLTDEPAPANTNVYVISVHILDCEANNTDGRDSIDFCAAWEISQTGMQTAPIRGVFCAPTLPWRPGDYDGLANQLSSAVADLSRTLDQSIPKQANGQSVP